MLISRVLIPAILKDWKSITTLLRIMLQMTQIFHFYSLCYIKVFEDPEEIIHRLPHKIITIKLMAFCQFLLYSQWTGICQKPNMGYDTSYYFNCYNNADFTTVHNSIFNSSLPSLRTPF
jgi:hypothetical protein